MLCLPCPGTYEHGWRYLVWQRDTLTGSGAAAVLYYRPAKRPGRGIREAPAGVAIAPGPPAKRTLM